MTRVKALVFAALLAAASPALADSLADSDRAAIQLMIANQIAAFQHDDGAGAYRFASPTIQQIFPTVDDFMAMVRNGYPPVYRPESVTFGRIVDSPAGPLQEVYITGPDGLGYVALYQLQRQPDGSWKINGCTLIRDQRPTI